MDNARVQVLQVHECRFVSAPTCVSRVPSKITTISRIKREIDKIPLLNTPLAKSQALFNFS